MRFIFEVLAYRFRATLQRLSSDLTLGPVQLLFVPSLYIGSLGLAFRVAGAGVVPSWVGLPLEVRGLSTVVET